jgi:hypothetical protein
VEWVIVVVRVPSEPSRHRVALWRELRRSGAIPLGAGIWALPSTALTTLMLERITDLTARAPDGELLVLEGHGRDTYSQDRLREQYTAAREAEWAEFLSDCAKFHAELAREVATEKFTLAELEEEEQSFHRLRRWHRELSLRDTFGAPSAAQAEVALKESGERVDEFAELVYRALGQ